MVRMECCPLGLVLIMAVLCNCDVYQPSREEIERFKQIYQQRLEQLQMPKHPRAMVQGPAMMMGAEHKLPSTFVPAHLQPQSVQQSIKRIESMNSMSPYSSMMYQPSGLHGAHNPHAANAAQLDQLNQIINAPEQQIEKKNEMVGKETEGFVQLESRRAMSGSKDPSAPPYRCFACEWSIAKCSDFNCYNNPDRCTNVAFDLHRVQQAECMTGCEEYVVTDPNGK